MRCMHEKVFDSTTMLKMDMWRTEREFIAGIVTLNRCGALQGKPVSLMPIGSLACCAPSEGQDVFFSKMCMKLGKKNYFNSTSIY